MQKKNCQNELYLQGLEQMTKQSITCLKSLQYILFGKHEEF